MSLFKRLSEWMERHPATTGLIGTLIVGVPSIGISLLISYIPDILVSVDAAMAMFFFSIVVISYYLTFTLYKTKIKLLRKIDKDNFQDTRTLKTVSVVGYMTTKSFQKVGIAGGILLAALLGYLIIDNFVWDLNLAFLMFLGIYSFVFAANQLAFRYRVSKGYYGTTASEAREIIQFIIDHSDDPDFPSGKKQIFPERDLEELRKTLPVSGGGEVQA
jgi:hypothetical protein